MKVVLAKTAYSPILKSAGDYSCGVFDAKGDMVAQGPDLPIHLGSMPDAVRAVVAAFGADVHDGDVFIHNDPYFGGSHLPDVNVVRPAFHDGRLLGFACVRAHWPDIGSRHARQLRRGHRDLRRGPAPAAAAARHPRARPTSTSRRSSSPTCARPTSARATSAPSSRPPCARPSGCKALAAALRRRARCSPTWTRCMDYSERLMRAALADLPDGEGYFEDFCDGDGILDDRRRRGRAVLDPHARQQARRPRSPSTSPAPTRR